MEDHGFREMTVAESGTRVLIRVLTREQAAQEASLEPI
jgi:tRNA G26 N,N-dimethylase Trm1